MHNDQENYDTFEYDQSDGEMYEPLTETTPKVNAPPLPPARNRAKLQDFRSGPFPRTNPPPSVPDCDENYEEFPSPIQDESMEEKYECFDDVVVEPDPSFQKRPPLPDRKQNEKPKPETKPRPKFSAFGARQDTAIKSLVDRFDSISTSENACNPSLGELLFARNNLKPTVNVDRVSVATKCDPIFKHPDIAKSKEKPQTPPKASFLSEINNRMKNFTLQVKETPSSMNRRKTSGSDQISKAPKKKSFETPPLPQSQPQPITIDQDGTDEEDPNEVYADACDARSFLENKPWYFGKLGRRAEERLLNDIKQNGAFLLRDSSQASHTHPFTLTVYSNDHFYRLKIRLLENGKFVVGEKKDSEIEFSTIPDLISYYQTEPLLLLATANNSNSCTTLKYIPEKSKETNA